MDKSMIRDGIQSAIDRLPAEPGNGGMGTSEDHRISESLTYDFETRCILMGILAELDKPEEGDPDAHLSDEAYLRAKQERFAKGGLANVDPDKYMEEVRGTGKVLTDEELERCYQRRRLAHAESGLTADEAHKAASEYKEDVAATLVIGPGKVFTEEEVRVMLEEMIDADALDRSEFAVFSYTIETVAAKHGLTLCPPNHPPHPAGDN